MAAPVIKSTSYDSQKGCFVERGTFTVTPGAITAGTPVTVNPDTSSPTCSVGDQIFVNPQSLTTDVIFVSCKVSSANTVQLVFNARSGSPTGLSTTFDYELYKYSSAT